MFNRVIHFFQKCLYLASLDFSEYLGTTKSKNVNFSSIRDGLPMQQESSLLGLSL